MDDGWMGGWVDMLVHLRRPTHRLFGEAELVHDQVLQRYSPLGLGALWGVNGRCVKVDSDNDNDVRMIIKKKKKRIRRRRRKKEEGEKERKKTE
jgi:hypothetical protein